MAARLARYFIYKILIIAESASVGIGSKMPGFAFIRRLGSHTKNPYREEKEKPT
jgi:hypothetical protein